MMQHIVITILLSTFAVVACTAQVKSDENVFVETKNLPAFTSICLDGVSKVNVHKGPQKVILKIDAEYADMYNFEVKNGRLFLGLKCSSFLGWWKLRNLNICEVDITVPDLDKIVVNGAGKIQVDDFDYQNLNVEMNGAAEVNVSGTVTTLEIGSNGAAKLDAQNLCAQNASVSMTGAGTIDIHVKEKLDAKLTGAGILLYRGNPKVNQVLTAAATLRQHN